MYYYTTTHVAAAVQLTAPHYTQGVYSYQMMTLYARRGAVMIVSCIFGTYIHAQHTHKLSHGGAVTREG